MRTEPVHREKIIVQVKGGGVNRSDVATLLGDVENQKAAAGVLIVLKNRANRCALKPPTPEVTHPSFGTTRIIRVSKLSRSRVCSTAPSASMRHRK